MSTLFEQYRLSNGDNIGDPATLNAVFESIDFRLNSVEISKSTFDEAIQELQAFGIARIDTALAPVYQSLSEITDVGVFFEATSQSEVVAGVGEITWIIDILDRPRFASPAYVSIMPIGQTVPAMLGTVISLDRTTGALVVNVDRVSGSGQTADQWRIGPASATDYAEAAELAAQAQGLAETARDQANIYRGDTYAFMTAAAGSASTAVAAASDAGDDAATAAAAQTAVVAAVATYNQIWLGAYASDPTHDHVGGALVQGAAYLNTTDGTLKYYLSGGWTSVVVPSGSTVLSVYGRTGNIIAALGDYDTTKISRTTGTGGVAGATAEAAYADLQTKINAKLASSAVSTFALTILDDLSGAAVMATIGALPIAGGALTGKLGLTAGVTGAASLNIPTGVAPTAPNDGDLWYIGGALNLYTGGAAAVLAMLSKAQAWTGKQTFQINGTSAGFRLNPGGVPTTLADGDEWATTAGRFARMSGATREFAFLDSPSFTGSPAAPTATLGTATTQLASTAFVSNALNALVNGSPGLLDTLKELADAIGDDPNFAATMTTALAGKLATSAVSTFVMTLLDDADAATARGTLGLTIGTNVMAYGVALEAFRVQTPAADRLPYYTSGTAASLATFTAYARTLLDDVDAATARGTLGLSIGSNVQAYSATLASIAALGTTADRLIYTTGAATFAEGVLTAFARTMLDDTSAVGVIATIGAVSTTAVAQVISGGARITPYSLGTPASAATLTLDPGNGPMQYLTNNAAFTLAPGTNKGQMTVEILNGATAGAITTTGFTSVKGDSFSTVNGAKFTCSVVVGQNATTLIVIAN